MKKVLKKLLTHVWNFINAYPIIVAAVTIYLYYLFTSINFFSTVQQKRSFFDYVLQFDSLIWMWVAAAALLQVQRLRKQQREESETRHIYQIEIERQQIHTKLLDDITMLLQDNINNPLAIISTQTQQIRRKFEADQEILRWIDNIESAMRRIENTIRELKVYETEKMISESAQRISKMKETPSS